MESDDRLLAALARVRMARKAGKVTVTREVTDENRHEKAAETRRLGEYLKRWRGKRKDALREFDGK